MCRLRRRTERVAYCLFFFNDTATTEIYTLSLHDALPISLRVGVVAALFFCVLQVFPTGDRDRKSTRLNSSHVATSYAVFCLKKKKRCARSDPRELQATHQLHHGSRRRRGPCRRVRGWRGPRPADGFLFLLMHRQPKCTLFPYTTLFR